ncbi:MAG: hypothetical protein HY370_10335 [Proteobacteria bacterium]|nr:hypothetical protein [Pseudomonadota bacterium]
MNTSDVHKKKRRKNLVLLALIFAWCALIWAVTMIRMARAEDAPPPSAEIAVSIGTDASIAHDATSSAWPAEVSVPGEAFSASRESHLQEISDTTQKYQEAGATHQAEVEEQRKSWWENWVDKINPEK